VDKAAGTSSDQLEGAFGTALPTRRQDAAWTTRHTLVNVRREQRSKLMADS
jgi:hypothetical protein